MLELTDLDVVSLDGAEVAVPDRASAFARAALDAGWAVRITTCHGVDCDNLLEPVRLSTLEATSEEGGGKRQRVYGDVKEVDSVAVRCRRGRDYLVAVWIDGSFDSATRPYRMLKLSSTDALDHVKHSHTWPCRYLPTSRGEVCVHHSERR